MCLISVKTILIFSYIKIAEIAEALQQHPIQREID